MLHSFIQYFNLNNSILGISAFYHDSAAALISNGEILNAFQEERLTRVRHDSSFPTKSILKILEINKLNLSDIDKIVFYEKPLIKFERLLETYLRFAPKGFNSFRKAIPIWIKEKLFQKRLLIKELKLIDKKFDEKKLIFSDHHLSHAASAFYPSPFKKALILTLDGVGEWNTTTISYGNENQIEILDEINYPHSLGLLYSAFTYYLGFKVNSGEYKMMGLAPYGKPIFKKIIYDNLIDVKKDGSFKINQKYFDYSTGLKMINKNFINLFQKPNRDPSKVELDQFHMDIASSIQEVTEEVILKIVKSLKQRFPAEENLCLAGGVALNCVANGKIFNKKYFKNIWIQPASGDAGGSLGAAYCYWFQDQKNKRVININDSMQGSYLGNEYSDKEIEKILKSEGAIFEKLENEDEICKRTASIIDKGNAVGWFQGKMEFGPRSLGARSILGDARSSKMQKILNLKIKFRESFRPFAPSVLEEDVFEWFELDSKSPYMLLVDQVKSKKLTGTKINNKEKDFKEILNTKRSDIPAVTHIDNSARIHTVSKKTNRIFYKLIENFKLITGCSVIVNTSFNVRGEPIVCTPSDAFRCFMGTNLDYLIIGNFLLDKKKQLKSLLNLDHKDSFYLD